MSEEQVADFKIAYDGTWFHNGAPIKREALAKLFSDRALKCDETGRHWLQTPFEKYPVEVADVPYIIVDYRKGAAGYDFITNMQEVVEVGPAHPLALRECRQTQALLPYVEVRERLFARLSRGMYYNLIQECGPVLQSRGGEYPLGKIEDDA